MTRPVLDHIVIGASSLEQGVNAMERRLGVQIPPGGAHPLMGTHNRLMRLGESSFLEVIAIDPAAPAPSRPRWYGLDDPAVRFALREDPKVIAWVLRSQDIERDAALASYRGEEIIRVSRGTLNWRLTVPEDGRLPWGGAFPHIIEWDGAAEPWRSMGSFDCQLDRLTLIHPDSGGLAAAIGQVLGELPDYLAVEHGDAPKISAQLNISGRQIGI